MADTNAQHVVPFEGRWAVKAENSERPSKIFDSKRMAISHAFDIADNNDGTITVHGEDGNLQSVKKTEDASKLMMLLKGQ